MQPRDGADCARAMFCGGRVKWGLTGQHRKGHPIGGGEIDPCHHRKIERTEVVGSGPTAVRPRHGGGTVMTR